MRKKYQPCQIVVYAIFFWGFLCFSSVSLAASDGQMSINEAAARLVQFCVDPKTSLDERAVAVLVDHVLADKPQKNKEKALPEAQKCPGGYYEFDAKVTFPRFMEYSYSSSIPGVITRPSSLRYSVWRPSRAGEQPLPASWKTVPPGGSPVIVRGRQHDSNTPDLTTGVYYEYDLQRTLIVLNYKGRQVLVSVSKQTGPSNVGEKGFIVGPDNSWTYYYSGQTGSAKAGLGWVKSYIYDYFSVGVYAELNPGSAGVRMAAFQWIRAGWSGMNFVESKHVVDGIKKRFARDTLIILESPRLPEAKQIALAAQSLSALPGDELHKKYAALQQAKQNAAIKAGHISQKEANEALPAQNIPKERMVEELMLEYLKSSLGKPALI
ncbi:MAG: hypothetical protein LBV07_00280 [Syntrophobacterales bacterium]|jgi:hypothetical protein|nr:hypothetical protein [Syntrophobacterales bacterium]